MAESAPVETRFAHGDLRPVAFDWQGQRHKISAYGRQWTAEDGKRHFLVMVGDGQPFELAQEPPGGRWTVVRTPAQFGQPGRFV